jgi:cold shock CspA family protein
VHRDLFEKEAISQLPLCRNDEVGRSGIVCRHARSLDARRASSPNAGVGGGLNSRRMRGCGSWSEHEDGFGWIVGDDGLKYLIRFFDIRMDGYQTLSEVKRVEFEVDPLAVGDEGSRVAVNVSPIR